MNTDDHLDNSRWQDFLETHAQHFNGAVLDTMIKDIQDIDAERHDYDIYVDGSWLYVMGEGIELVSDKDIKNANLLIETIKGIDRGMAKHVRPILKSDKEILK